MYKRQVVRKWYDGYIFGKINVYCPWDVINYCDELLADPTISPKNYWANTSGNSLILRLLQKADQTTKDQIEELINGGTIMKSIRQELTYRDIDDSVDNIWSVLYATGYLTGKHVENEDADIFALESVRNLVSLEAHASLDKISICRNLLLILGIFCCRIFLLLLV